MHSRLSRTSAFPVSNDATLLQMPSVYHYLSCDGFARDAEENWSTKRSQEKTERHLYLSIK